MGTTTLRETSTSFQSTSSGKAPTGFSLSAAEDPIPGIITSTLSPASTADEMERESETTLDTLNDTSVEEMTTPVSETSSSSESSSSPVSQPSVLIEQTTTIAHQAPIPSIVSAVHNASTLPSTTNILETSTKAHSTTIYTERQQSSLDSGSSSTTMTITSHVPSSLSEHLKREKSLSRTG